MQAYTGYIENGRIYPTGMPLHITGRRKVIITVLDEPVEIGAQTETSDKTYSVLLDELYGSIDDATFTEPPEILWEHSVPGEEML